MFALTFRLAIGTAILAGFLCFAVPAEAALININTAGVAELETLNGIGAVKAQAIIDYRQSNGLFQNIIDIKNVSGIGEVTYSNIRDFITVGEATASDSTNDSSTDEDTAATTTSETNFAGNGGQSSGPASAHYSAAPLTALSSEAELAVGAGRDRLGTSGAPMEFRAEVNRDHTSNINFTWAFGDGTVAYGETVSHSYAYPGEYIVVLNASGAEGKAVSRSNVKVVAPLLTITSFSGEKIEVANSSQNEVNLHGRALVGGGKVFVFPQDTIIKAGRKISFASEITGISGYASLIVIGQNSRPDEILANLEALKQVEVERLSSELNILQSQLARIQAEEQLGNLTVEPPSGGPTVTEIPESSTSNQTALALSAVSPTTTEKVSWFETIKSFFRIKK